MSKIASAVSDNVRGVPDRHFGDAITRVIAARYGVPAGANIAGYRAGQIRNGAAIIEHCSRAVVGRGVGFVLDILRDEVCESGNGP
jgi:hypothetical protein